jgi:hypothetical protein
VAVDAAWVLDRAAFIANHHDRNAQGDVRYNKTDSFHLCGLIERAASVPKSGATHRRCMGSDLIDAAKAAFCRAHNVIHPSVWEWGEKRTWQQVQQALLQGSAVEQASHKENAG